MKEIQKGREKERANRKEQTEREEEQEKAKAALQELLQCMAASQTSLNSEAERFKATFEGNTKACGWLQRNLDVEMHPGSWKFAV